MLCLQWMDSFCFRMQGQNVRVVMLVVVVVAMVADFPQIAMGSFSPCRPCFGDDCDLEPEGCLYGTARDPCGRLICAAGPGDRCGGRDNHLGRCGDGMDCRCGYCRGCSTVRFLQGHIDCDWSNRICHSA